MPQTCSICKRPLDDPHGHNAQPINDGRCCSGCNAALVIPARLVVAGGAAKAEGRKA